MHVTLKGVVDRVVGRLVAAVVVGALFATGAPLAAAAFDASNADKIDGRHAVGAGASIGARAGKLVATNAKGRLPGNIIARAPDAARLGGAPPAAYQRRIAGACAPQSAAISVSPIGGVACAIDGIDGGNAQTLDGQDSADFKATPNRTVAVRVSGTAEENGTALRSALATLHATGAPSASNPWVVTLELGDYALGQSQLLVPPFVTIQGQGAATVLSSGRSISDFDESAVRLEVGSGLRDMTVRNNTAQTAGAVFVSDHGVGIRNVTIEAAGLGAYGLSLRDFAGDTELDELRITVTGGLEAVGIRSSADLEVRDSDVNATGTSFESVGIAILMEGDDLVVDRTRLQAQGGGSTALTAASSATVRGSALIGLGGAAIQSTPTVRIVASMVQGSITGATVTTCLRAYSSTYAPLNGTCQ